MAYLQMLPMETTLNVEGLYTVHHFSLSGRPSEGELHDFYEVVYVESGFYCVLLDGKRNVVPPGSCVFFSPNTYHSQDECTPNNATVRIITFECKSEGMQRFDNRIFALTAEEKEAFLKAFSAAFHCLEYAPNYHLRLKDDCNVIELQRIKALLECFLLALYRNANPLRAESGRLGARKADFRRISDYLKDNLHRRLTLSVISEECSVSISKLKALCRLFCDCGPIDYLISLRLIRAKHLILEGELNFSEIAEQTGFATPHYFSRVFRERTGITPTQYADAPYQHGI